MKIKVTQVNPWVSQQYPYTHRVEVIGQLAEWEEIVDWLTDNEIPCSVIYGNAVYLNPANTSFFVMRWS